MFRCGSITPTRSRGIGIIGIILPHRAYDPNLYDLPYSQLVTTARQVPTDCPAARDLAFLLIALTLLVDVASSTPVDSQCQVGCPFGNHCAIGVLYISLPGRCILSISHHYGRCRTASPSIAATAIVKIISRHRGRSLC